MERFFRVFLLVLLSSVLILSSAGCGGYKQNSEKSVLFSNPPKIEVEKIDLPKNAIPLYINEQKKIFIVAKHLPDTGENIILVGNSISDLKPVLTDLYFPAYNLFVNPFNENIMYLFGPGEIYFSKDAGNNWSSASNSFNFTTLGFSYNGTMYFAGPGARKPCYIYKSKDGIHFTEIYKPHPYHDITSFAFNPDNTNVIWTFGEYGVFISKDAGKTFRKLSNFDRAYAGGAINPYNYSEVYVGLGNCGLYKIKDDGTLNDVYVSKEPLERFVSVLTDLHHKITYAIDDNGNLFCILKGKVYKLYILKHAVPIKLLLNKNSDNLYILCSSAYYRVKINEP